MRARGFFGIGIYRPKTTENMGMLWRCAHNFGASFLFTIGARYRRHPADTTDAAKHVPLFQYADFSAFAAALPAESRLVFIEQSGESRSINATVHPERAVYILGAEDSGIPDELMRGHQVIHVDTARCLNVAVAGALVMFDRQSKSVRECKKAGRR